MTKNVTVLLTHIWNDSIQNVYRELKKIHDVIILFDKDSKFYNESLKTNKDMRFFSEEDLKNVNMVKFDYRKYCDIAFFNDFAPIVLYADELLQYDYIYLWEYDVRFNGDYNYLFDSLKDVSQDLIVTRGMHKHTNKHDGWWPDNESKEYYYEKYPLKKEKSMMDIPIEYWYRALFCFSRLSNRLLKVLKDELPKYPEYFELIVPTLCLYNNMTITNVCYCGNKDLMSSTWSWMPYTGKMDEKNKLYHAIK